MSRLAPPPTTTGGGTGTQKPLAVGLLESIGSFLSRLTRQAGGARKKLAINSAKSPLAKPKQLFVTLSNNFRQKKKVEEDHDQQLEVDDELDFGDGGLWQRDILMGDKCQPLDFSGVIYYDSNGKRLSELPMKSPRASPLPSYLQAASEK